MKTKTLSVLYLALIMSTAAFGATYHVATTGDDVSNDGLSWGAPLLSLEVAIAKATTNDIILLNDGTHNITSFWAEVTIPLTIRSVNGPEATILKATRPSYIIDTTTYTMRRVMRVNDPDAVISGLSFIDAFSSDSAYTQPDGTQACSLRLEAGTVTNCIVRDNQGMDNSGGAQVRGGLLTHSKIYNNTADRGNNPNVGLSGGLWVSGGIVEHCVISNNYARMGGGGLQLTGGTVRDAEIVNNYTSKAFLTTAGSFTYGGPIGVGGGVYQTGGLLERSTIRGNKDTFRGAGVYMNGTTAIMQDCLITDNEAYEYSGGVWLVKGNVFRSTIAENRVLSRGFASGLRQEGGIVSNSIIFANSALPYHAEADEVDKSGGTFTYSCTVPAVSGTGNVAADPLFENVATGDYRLTAGSPAQNMGAYAYTRLTTGPLNASFTASVEESLDSVTTTLTAYTGGEDAAGTWFGWDLDNNSIIDISGTDKQSITHTFGYGFHDITLVVSNASDEVATHLRRDCIRVGAVTNYVSLTGSHEPPFETPAKAATNVQQAVDAVWTASASPATVWVASGTYPIPEIWL